MLAPANLASTEASSQPPGAAARQAGESSFQPGGTIVEPAFHLGSTVTFQPGTIVEPAKKKKARRPTGTLRKWTVEEENQLRDLVATLGEQKAKRADFDGFAVTLNMWAQREGVVGSDRTGYAVEQRWQLYLRPEATRAAKAATAVERQQQEEEEARQAVVAKTAAVEADHADAPDVSAAERVAADARANYEAALEAARRSLGGA